MKVLIGVTAVLSILFGAAAAQPPDGTILLREVAALPAGASEAAQQRAKGIVLERIIYASRGGLMTYLALKRSNRFKAAIVGAGIGNFEALLEERPMMTEHVFRELIPGWEDPVTRAQALKARSAVGWAEQLPAQTPILLLQGTADWRVDPTQALDMARALLIAKRPYRLVMLEGGDHGLSEYRDEVDRLVAEWLDRYVRDGANWPSLKPHGR